MHATPQFPVPGRSCDGCAMCCKLGEIPQVKPFNQWCTHCSTHQRCDIYATRPAPCRQFYCHYLLSDVDEAWAPNQCGMVVSTYEHPSRLTISVDPDRPARWREQPYLPQIQHWANFGAVTIMEGLHAYAAYPDRIDDLGVLDVGEELIILEQETTRGLRYRIERAPR